MIEHYAKQAGTVVSTKWAEPGGWINIYPPFNRAEIEGMSKRLNIPFDYFIDSLDVDERSRFESDDGLQFIVLNTPVSNLSAEIEADYITVPLGIIESEDYLVTISSVENQVVKHFQNNQFKKLDIDNHSNFVLRLFDQSNHLYLHYLKELNRQRNAYEKELYNSSRNKELAKLLNIQKSLVYFLTSLRANELMMMKIKRTDFLQIKDKEEELDFLEDIIVDCSQALEMSDVYTNILNGTMDAFASIISNNLNNIMKRLTAITIVLMVPTLVASFYGMNVALPFDKSPYAFVIIMVLSLLLSFLLIFVFNRRKWF